jgi:hypothetical protein
LDGEEEQEAGGAGSWSLLGFDYQADVSVWLALDLMVGARLTSEMILEHVSEEDVEADVEEMEPESVATSIPMRGYRLIVQAKRRTGNAWTEAKFITLLNHGKRRRSAKQRLDEDPDARYLLVTSAALNAPVHQLGIRRAGAWPAANKAPPKIAALGKDIAGRVAIIGGEDDERLVTDIKELLIERFRVPRAQWKACLNALRDVAWGRMGGDAGGRWTREEVEQVVLEHDGYLVSAPELEVYVKPTNWGDLKQALRTRHAAIIIGQSGSGKTMTSDALWQELKGEIPDLQRVHITHGPDQLRADKTLPPVLYDIEDPWGRFRFEPDSRPWNDQLAPAFQSARHDRLFVATSRIDVALSSGALDTVQRWRVPLDAENYGKQERQRLYRNLTAGLPPELASFTHEREQSVLRQLSLPLEIRKFFDALPGLDRDEIEKNADLALAQAVEQAHRDSIERTVIDQVEARDAVKAAAILWALIKPHGRLSADVLRSIEDPLVDADPSLGSSIGQLINSFVTARNFRQGADGSLAYYHGKVEAGIEAVLAKNSQAVRRTLRTLVDVLVARDEDTGASWGIETAAEIIRLSDRIPDGRPQITRASEDRLDSWLEQKIRAAGNDLETALTLAAAVGSSRNNLSELARWLTHRPDKTFPGLMDWGKPAMNDAWYHRLRADPLVGEVVEAFVRTVLPSDRTSFPKQFGRDLAALAGDLTDAFVDAAATSVGYGYIRNDKVIAAVALTDIDRFEPVVDAAVDARRPTESELTKAAHDRLIIINDEVPEDYAEHLADNDDGATAEAYLEAYVERVRAERGWQAIAAHRHLGALRPYWLRALANEKTVAPAAEELEAAFNAGYGKDNEELVWAVLTKHWDARFADALTDRMVVGDPETDARRAALDCFADHLSKRMPNLIRRLVVGESKARLAQLASDLAHRAARRGHDARKRYDAAREMIAMLPEVFRELASAEVALIEGKAPVMSVDALGVITTITDPPEDVRAMRVRIAQHLNLEVGDDIRWILANSDDNDDALSAIKVAVQREMTAELEAALDHKFAHVAARALTAIAEPLAAPLPQAILERASRDSSPVRKALVAQLKAKPHPEHLAALRVLTGDKWSKYAQRETDDGDYPIARDAAEAIAALPAVPDEVLDQFLNDAKTTEDLNLMRGLLSCVVKHGGNGRQAQVVAMSRKGRRLAVGQAAAYSLLEKYERLADETVALITTDMVLKLPSSIAGSLVVTVGLRGEFRAVDAVADGLAASDDRKIFLSLLAVALHDRDPERSAAITAKLPEGHPARRWAQGEALSIDRPALIDLGDASAVKEALTWMAKSGG